VAQLYPQPPSTYFSRLLRHAWASCGFWIFSSRHHNPESLSKSSWRPQVWHQISVCFEAML